MVCSGVLGALIDLCLLGWSITAGIFTFSVWSQWYEHRFDQCKEGVAYCHEYYCEPQIIVYAFTVTVTLYVYLFIYKPLMCLCCCRFKHGHIETVNFLPK